MTAVVEVRADRPAMAVRAVPDNSSVKYRSGDWREGAQCCHTAVSASGPD